nr:hypothetical protein [Microbispora rosea]
MTPLDRQAGVLAHLVRARIAGRVWITHLSRRRPGAGRDDG